MSASHRAPEPRLDEVVKDMIAEQFDLPREQVDLDLPITDAPDSIGLSVLVASIEQRFGVTLEDRAVARARSFRDLVRMVEVQRDAAARR